VCCRVALAEIRFGFDDAAGENSWGVLRIEQFAQQRPRHAPRIAIEEGGLRASRT
jgi:hypothetical protein